MHIHFRYGRATSFPNPNPSFYTSMPPRDSSGPGSGPNPFSGSGPGGPFLTAVTISENGPFPTTVTEPIPPPPSQDIPTLTVAMTPVVQSLSLETVTSGHMTLTKTHVATQSDTVVNPSSGAIGTGNASAAASGANGSANGSAGATATTTTTAVAAAVAGTAHSSVLSRGVLIGIIATGVGLIALIIFLVALLIRRGKRRRSEEEMFKPTAFTPVEDEHRILSPKEAGRQEMTQQRPVDDGGLAASGGQQADVKRWPEEEPDPEEGRERQVQVHEGEQPPQEQPPSPLPPPVNGPGGNHDPLVLPLASLARSFNPNETFFSPGTQGPPSISRIPPGTLDLSSYPLMPAFQLSPPGGPGTGYVSTESVLSRPPGFHTAGQGDQDSFLDMTGLGHGHGFRSGSGEYHVAEIPVLIRRDARGGGIGGQAVAFGLLEEPAPPYKERASSRVSAVEEGTGGDEPDAQEAEAGSSGVVSLPEQETEVADAERSLL